MGKRSPRLPTFSSSTRQNFHPLSFCATPDRRKQGTGRQLIEAWEEHSIKSGIVRLRLKCPVDLSANGFYLRLGFSRVDIEAGKHRPLVILEKKILPNTNHSKGSQFAASFSARVSELNRLFKPWESGGDSRQPHYSFGCETFDIDNIPFPLIVCESLPPPNNLANDRSHQLLLTIEHQ